MVSGRSGFAKVLVNAAGPWINEVAERLAPRPPGCAVDLVQGAHIEVPGVLEQGIYYTEARDRRAVFTIPWKGRTLVGTTELTYTGDPADVVAPQIDQHNMFGALLGVGQQLLCKLPILFGSRAPRAGSGDGPNFDLVPLFAHQHLR